MRAAISFEIAAFILVLNYRKAVFSSLLNVAIFYERIDLVLLILIFLEANTPLFNVQFMIKKGVRLSDFKLDSDNPIRVKWG